MLSGALKIADKFTVTMEAVGNKIRLNSQGWEDARMIGDRQVAMVVAYKGQHYLLPEHRQAKFEQNDQIGLHEAGYGPERLRMTNALRRERKGVSSGGYGVSGNGNGVSLDEDNMTFGEHGLSAEAKRAVSTTRVREFRKR